MFELFYTKLIVVHVISVMVAVGTVTVTDYLHVLGLRDPELERRTLFVYPHLSKLITIALGLIYVSGAMLVFAKPELLQSTLFLVKMFLVVLVTINGFVLHKFIFPKIEHGVRRKSYPTKLIKQAAFAGSLSVVSWYAIVVLAITKKTGYNATQFIVAYLVALVIAYFTALHMELNFRKTKK